MATKQIFDGQTIIIPGVRSTIKSGIVNPTLDLAYGNMLVIDTGSGANYGGGAGFDGELASGKDDTFYEFNSFDDFRTFTHGGLWWLLASPLFKPGGVGVNGISKITYIKAATTTAASIVIELTGDTDASDSVAGTNGGDITIKVRTEGLIGNGALSTSGDNLKKGYAFKMTEGKNDTSKFIFKFYRGTFKGLDQNSIPYNGVDEETAVPQLICQSPEVDNIEDLITWMTDDFTFNTYFKLTDSTVTGTGAIGDGDLDTYTDYTLASGGTESYSSDVLADVLDAINDLYVQFVLCDKYGDNAQHQNNLDIVDWAANDSKYKPEVYIAAGNDISDFATSKTVAAAYDNDGVTVVHGAPKLPSRAGNGFKLYDSIYKAAAFLGREAGLAPQVPLTFKSIDIAGEQHPLNDKETEQALEAGLLVSRLNDGEFECVKGVNTLQENDFIINEDGTTHSKQLKRIARQLNNELIINARRQLLKQKNGVNVNTLSAARIKSWTEGYLKTKIATQQSDNLITFFKNVTVTKVADSWRINYEFGANGEISFLFFTGVVIDF